MGKMVGSTRLAQVAAKTPWRQPPQGKAPLLWVRPLSIPALPVRPVLSPQINWSGVGA